MLVLRDNRDKWGSHELDEAEKEGLAADCGTSMMTAHHFLAPRSVLHPKVILSHERHSKTHFLLRDDSIWNVDSDFDINYFLTKK